MAVRQIPFLASMGTGSQIAQRAQIFSRSRRNERNKGNGHTDGTDDTDSWSSQMTGGVAQIRLKRVNYKLDSGKIRIFATK